MQDLRVMEAETPLLELGAWETLSSGSESATWQQPQYGAAQLPYQLRGTGGQPVPVYAQPSEQPFPQQPGTHAESVMPQPGQYPPHTVCIILCLFLYYCMRARGSDTKLTK